MTLLLVDWYLLILL